MSGTLPSDPQPREVEIRSVTATLVSMGQAMARQARSKGAQRWGIKFIYPPMTREQWAPIFAFLVKQRGRYETYQVVLPTPLYLPQGSIPGAPVVNNQAGSPEQLQTGLRSVESNGWTSLQMAVLKAGDFIKYAGHSKVYMVVSDVDSDSNGRASVEQEPALIEGPAHGSAIAVSSVPFTVAMVNDTLQSVLSVDPRFGIEIDMLEAYP